MQGKRRNSGFRAKRLLSLLVEEHGADLLEALRSLLAPRCELFRVHQEHLQPVIEAIGRHIFCRRCSPLNHNLKSSLRSALRPITPWSVRQNSNVLKFHRDHAEIDRGPRVPAPCEIYTQQRRKLVGNRQTDSFWINLREEQRGGRGDAAFGSHPLTCFLGNPPSKVQVRRQAGAFSLFSPTVQSWLQRKKAGPPS
jgi:hypothetical protein